MAKAKKAAKKKTVKKTVIKKSPETQTPGRDSCPPYLYILFTDPTRFFISDKTVNIPTPWQEGEDMFFAHHNPSQNASFIF